mmetsp:Transcript_34560/g.90157  ORF Transcript_34560/g.90157 Transcript_34560/m.90157 type:complete len:269 (-) Transcript_34560:858-1664(-)
MAMEHLSAIESVLSRAERQMLTAWLAVRGPVVHLLVHVVGLRSRRDVLVHLHHARRVCSPMGAFESVRGGSEHALRSLLMLAVGGSFVLPRVHLLLGAQRAAEKPVGGGAKSPLLPDLGSLFHPRSDSVLQGSIVLVHAGRRRVMLHALVARPNVRGIKSVHWTGDVVHGHDLARVVQPVDLPLLTLTPRGKMQRLLLPVGTRTRNLQPVRVRVRKGLGPGPVISPHYRRPEVVVLARSEILLRQLRGIRPWARKHFLYLRLSLRCPQ